MNTTKKDEALKQALERIAQLEAELMRMQGRELKLKFALAEQPAQQGVDWEKLYRLEVKKKEALAVKYERDTGKKLTRIVPMAEQPAQQQEPVAWRELCRRLYVELYWCDRQMMATLDEDGEPVWTQGKTVRDVLADAKAALETSPPASKPWAGLTEEQVFELIEANTEWKPAAGLWRLNEVEFARAIEAKLREKNA